MSPPPLSERWLRGDGWKCLDERAPGGRRVDEALSLLDVLAIEEALNDRRLSHRRPGPSRRRSGRSAEMAGQSAAARGRREAGAIAALVTLVMGARAGEVVRRVVRDLDDDGRLLWIPDSETEAGKRTLQVPDLLRSRLLELAEGKKAEELLFGYHDRNWPRKWVAKICKAAGGPRVTAHRMRGLHGTLAVDTGISAHAVAAAPGHESVTTTLQRYAQAGAGTGARQEKVLTVLGGGKRDREHAA